MDFAKERIFAPAEKEYFQNEKKPLRKAVNTRVSRIGAQPIASNFCTECAILTVKYTNTNNQNVKLGAELSRLFNIFLLRTILAQISLKGYAQ
jgi:hypothetical protein